MPTIACYEIDCQWRIIRANDAFCRLFHCTDSVLIGRDIRDLMRDDWRLDFRTYVARALMGVGDYETTIPMTAPCGEDAWFKHTLRPIHDKGHLQGYRATVTPHVVHAAAPAPRRWDWRPSSPSMVWDFDDKPLARAS